MRDTFGEGISFTLFGESHGTAIGGVLHGVAPGVFIDMDFIAQQTTKRRAKGDASTKRQEPDDVIFLSGIKDGYATGTAIAFEIKNTNTKSADYKSTQDLLRPGHADYTAHAKYGGFQDARGGGHFSGRLTAPVVVAGSILQSVLMQKGVYIGTHILRCANVSDDNFAFDETALKSQIDKLNGITEGFAALNSDTAKAMLDEVLIAAKEGDSVGGVLETAVLGLPAGLGEPFFTSVESVLSSLLFSMPAVKGVEFGAGFAIADEKGSTANDEFYMRKSGETQQIATKTNNNGGINGGITNGMPIIFRTAVKPTPSIFKQQNTVDFANAKDATLQIHGRHDPCIVHRARVVQDSLVALGLAELLNMTRGTAWQHKGEKL